MVQWWASEQVDGDAIQASQLRCSMDRNPETIAPAVSIVPHEAGRTQRAGGRVRGGGAPASSYPPPSSSSSASRNPSFSASDAAAPPDFCATSSGACGTARPQSFRFREIWKLLGKGFPGENHSRTLEATCPSGCTCCLSLLGHVWPLTRVAVTILVLSQVPASLFVVEKAPQRQQPKPPFPPASVAAAQRGCGGLVRGCAMPH